MPFTIGSGTKNNLEVRSNKAEAEEGIKVTSNASATNNTIAVSVRVVWSTANLRTLGGVTVTLLDYSGKVIQSQEVSPLSDVSPNSDETGAASVQVGSVSFSGLNPSTAYKIQTIGTEALLKWWTILTSSSPIGGGMMTPDISYTASANPLVVTTNATGNTTTNNNAGTQVVVNDAALLPQCVLMDATTWLGCIGRVTYWALFTPTSYIFGLTGRLLDISVDYSTKDTSYRSPFVVEGWGVIRDFCNMFFIFVLLYIAFGTILNLHGVKTKEMIINVVIIGLLINFSLFAVQVIIDASNILTRIFYNQQTIVVGPMINGVVQNETGSQGEIQLSAALVAKINPQKLIIDASKVGNIQNKETMGGNGQVASNGVSAKTFLLVTILAVIVNVVGLVTFLFSSLIFISRVIGLWLAMIFAPFAFFSYTVPALQDMDMVGWKKWWPETIKLAFLAPVFVFFIYLIIKFLDTGLGLVINDSKGGLDFILGIFVPFIFIMILLTKAKDIAKDMSGKIGQSITNGLAKVGGMALGVAGGAALGLGATALRGTVGRAGSAIANSETLKKAESRGVFGAKTLRNIGNTAGKGSMDIRGVKIAGKDIGAATGLNVGRAKEGGFDKIRADKTAERKKRADELKVGEDSALKQNLNKTETDLQKLLNANKFDLDRIDKTIEIKRQALNDINAQYGGGSDESKKAGLELSNAKREKEALRKGQAYTGDEKIVTDKRIVQKEIDTGLVDASGKKIMKTESTEEEYTKKETDASTAHNKYVNVNAGMGKYFNKVTGLMETKARTIDQLENTEVKEAKHRIEDENKARNWNYAKYISSNRNKIMNLISSGGQHSSAGADEAAHKIRMDIKVDSGDKGHQGGGHGPEKAPPPPLAPHAPKAEAAHDSGGDGHDEHSH